MTIGDRSRNDVYSEGATLGAFIVVVVHILVDLLVMAVNGVLWRTAGTESGFYTGHYRFTLKVT